MHTSLQGAYLLMHFTQLFGKQLNRLELSGLNVIAFCCGGASPNRKFYKMHRDSSKELVYKTPNPYCNERDIFFICDVRTSFT